MRDDNRVRFCNGSVILYQAPFASKGVSMFELPKRIFLAAALALSPAALIAQVASASLGGVVQDATGAGVISSQSNSPRTIQFGLKLLF
jgi:hypothetical protein